MNARKFKFVISAALNYEWTTIHMNFRSVRQAADHIEFIRKIGAHQNLKYRIQTGDGKVVKTYPKFASA